MNLNEFSQKKSHVVQIVRNHIAKKHFVSKIILSVSNSHERLGEAMDKFHVKFMPNMKTRFIPMLLQCSSCISKTIFLSHTNWCGTYQNYNTALLIWRFLSLYYCSSYSAFDVFDTRFTVPATQPLMCLSLIQGLLFQLLTHSKMLCLIWQCVWNLYIF